MSWSQPYPWALALTLCAALAVWGKHPKRMPVHWVFKPLTTALIWAVAWLMVQHSPARPWVLWALGFSMIGDIALMLPNRFFPVGLISFLLALACYAWAFTEQIAFEPRQLLYLLLPLAVALALLNWLWPHLGKLRIPASFYVLGLALMAWRAVSRFDALDVSLRAWFYGCLGASLFILGDTLLARRRFAGEPVRYSVELGTYYLAQWCLVASMW